MTSRTETSCRSCGGARLREVLSLGRMPLANALLASAEEDATTPRFPLDLVFCEDCALVQITETVDPEVLFGHYLYFSSFSETMVRHAGDLATRIIQERTLGPRSLVVEVASNDGYLLQHYARNDIPVLGVEPAENVAEAARQRGVDTLSAFFDEAVARRIREERGPAHVIHAHNVLAHVKELNGFVAGLRALLDPAGVVVIEVPYVRDLVEARAFDTIYHEHLCYFSVTALAALFRRHGLQPVAVEHVAIHGGSLRIWAGHSGSPGGVEGWLAAEKTSGLAGFTAYEHFGRACVALGRDLKAMLEQLAQAHGAGAGYGAAAKATVLLNFLGLPPGLVQFVAEKNPAKQGRFIPGVRIPVEPAEALEERRPPFCVIFPWNIAEEIMAQQSAYLRQGGRFVIPVPAPRLVSHAVA